MMQVTSRTNRFIARELENWKTKPGAGSSSAWKSTNLSGWSDSRKKRLRNKATKRCENGKLERRAPAM